jgi:hypothetical protein
MFALNSRLRIDHAAGPLIGKIVGIDIYGLQSCDDQALSWDSYTLVTEETANLRFWVVNWHELGWILMMDAQSILPPPNYALLLQRTGIAQISFRGDAGVSTPTASLSSFGDGYGHYFIAEKFLASKTMFFAGEKIAMPHVHKYTTSD